MTTHHSAAASTNYEPLVDRFGRVHRSLRISVTDRCNIRCQYCMPAVGAEFLPSERLLSFEQFASFVRVLARLGINDLRITGGEPLLRPNLAQLIKMLSEIEGIDDLALTTNGMFLAQQIGDLVAAGLKRINISLDTLREETFRTLARRKGLQAVLDGIAATKRFPHLKVRLNALVLRDLNLDEIIPLAEFACAQSLPLRFIEFMPLDAERAWNKLRMVSGKEVRELLNARFGTLSAIARDDASQPSIDYALPDGQGVIGFIDSVSQPFCSTCDRLRLTAEGKMRNCLFGQEEWDMSELLKRSPLDEAQLIDRVRTCVSRKKAAHGMEAPGFQPPERAMFQIGG